MAVALKVITVSTFPDLETLENFLRDHTPFSPAEAVTLLEEKMLIIKEPRDMEVMGTTSPTSSVFTLEEVEDGK